MSLDQCPTQRELAAFAVGNLSSRSLARLEGHVEECPQCQEALAQADAEGDELVSELSRSAAAIDVEPAPDHVLASARAAVCDAPRSGGDVALDSGKHYARLLRDGPCRLGRFELLAELGVGSFGYVFRARDVELDRTVAIKVQRAGAFASPEDVARFLREARSAAALSHPAIVALYDTGHSEDGVCFLVTEYVDGQTLEARLKEARVEQRAAATLIADVADAVQYAHEHSIVHRDLKPSNIILDKSGRPHVTDFGLAKRDDGGEAPMTSDGRVMGTPAYMSPEQAAGTAIDARTDIYSLGVILYELLTGERPFHGGNRLLLLQVLEDEPRPPRQLEPRIPKDLETICVKALAKSPARRYQTAAQLAGDLRRFLKGEPIEARPMGSAERLWRWCRRYPVAPALVAAVVVGAIAGFFYLTSLSSYFVRATALDSARMEADMLEKVNEYYSDLLDRLEPGKVVVTEEYKKRRDALPLPATFTIESAHRISQSESGLKFRLYSDHPFRKDVPPLTDLEKEALKILTERSRQQTKGKLEHHRFDMIGGRPFLSYARGQIMKESCVKCHNGYEKSPKRDWKEGDLVGVLLITRPLEQDIQRTQSGLRSAFFVMGAVVVFVVAGAVIVAMQSRQRR